MSAITDAVIVVQAKVALVVAYVKANKVQLSIAAVASAIIGHLL